MGALAFNLGQGVSLSSGKFGVGQEHVNGKGNFVGDALTGAMAATEKLKVLNTILIPNPIDVMNSLVFGKRSPNVLLHDMAMLKHFHFLASSTDRSGNGEPDVTAPFDMSPNFTSEKTMTGLSLNPGVFADNTAKFLSRIVFYLSITANITNALLRSAALNAGKNISAAGLSVLVLAHTFARAVHGVAAMHFTIGRDIARLHGEYFTVKLTGKFNGRDLRASNFSHGIHYSGVSTGAAIGLYLSNRGM